MTGIRLFTIGAAALLAAAPSFAQQKFQTADAAAQALIDAAERHDSATLAQILGPQATAILTSGKPEQDKQEQAEFARMARAKQRLEVSSFNANRAVLSIGDEDWPFPVPLRKLNGQWSFDPSQTAAEMHARKLGADELDAIEVCHGYVEAQQKYAEESHERGGMPVYAARFVSTVGKQDGLYWQNGESLIPEGLAQAGWDSANKSAKPYHGYYYRILSAQGPDAPGGAHNYVVKNRLMGGFALVAWPAQYGVTGIHTFIVNQDGTIYEKDRAPEPGKPLAPITRFDPDRTWRPVE